MAESRSGSGRSRFPGPTQSPMTSVQTELIGMLLAFSLAAISCHAESLPSFTNAPYIHPKIVENLVSMISDSGDQRVAMDIDGSQDCNLLFSESEPYYTNSPCPGGGYEERRNGQYLAFDYRYVGRTSSGVNIVRTSSNDGGSGCWHHILFMVIETDYGLHMDLDKSVATLTRPRRLLKKLGTYFLGDRWKGMLKVEGDKVYIGKDHGWFTENPDMGDIVERTNDWATILTVDLAQPK